jgi:hypothetical protein
MRRKWREFILFALTFPESEMAFEAYTRHAINGGADSKDYHNRDPH